MYAEFSLPPEWRRCEEVYGSDCKYSRPDPMTGSSRLPSSTAAVFTQFAEIGERSERERPILRNQPISILECFESSTSLGFALHVMNVPRLGVPRRALIVASLGTTTTCRVLVPQQFSAAESNSTQVENACKQQREEDSREGLLGQHREREKKGRKKGSGGIT